MITKILRTIQPLIWLRSVVEWYWWRRYIAVHHDEPNQIARGAYNLQRRRNRALRSGNVARALHYAESLELLLTSWETTSSEADTTEKQGIEVVEPDSPPSALQSEIKIVVEKGTTAERYDEYIYYTDAAFLVRCWLWLMQPANPPSPLKDRFSHHNLMIGDPEWACLVTGPCIDGVRMMTHKLTVRYDHQSPSKVGMALEDFHRALRGLQRWGYSLHGVFHSHRTSGPVSPSRIDFAAQRQVLEPTYPAIQGVFSEDGYLRFFSGMRPFEVKVYGQGVEHVEDTLYKLDEGLLKAAQAGSIWTPLVAAG